MSENKHTPEPWRANELQADIDGRNGEAVAVCYCNDDNGDDAIANARRIVACVNSCAGIPTDWLESGTVGCLKNVRDERDMYLKQRDELLAALDGLLKAHRITFSRRPPETVEQAEKQLDAIRNAVAAAESAIASVKGNHTEQPLEMVGTSAPAIVFYPAGSLGEYVESEGGEA